jgi:hypothetical protein
MLRSSVPSTVWLLGELTARPSTRPDFSVGACRVFFTIEERLASIVVCELARPSR